MDRLKLDFSPRIGLNAEASFLPVFTTIQSFLGNFFYRLIAQHPASGSPEMNAPSVLQKQLTLLMEFRVYPFKVKLFSITLSKDLTTEA